MKVASVIHGVLTCLSFFMWAAAYCSELPRTTRSPYARLFKLRKARKHICNEKTDATYALAEIAF